MCDSQRDPEAWSKIMCHPSRGCLQGRTGTSHCLPAAAPAPSLGTAWPGCPQAGDRAKSGSFPQAASLELWEGQDLAAQHNTDVSNRQMALPRCG